MCWSIVCATRLTAKKTCCTPFGALVMSSNLLNRISRAFSFRLNLWYATIFTISACALYVFLYVILAVAMGQKDRDVIEAQLKEYSIVYQGGGLRALKSVLEANL